MNLVVLVVVAVVVGVVTVSFQSLLRFLRFLTDERVVCSTKKVWSFISEKKVDRQKGVLHLLGGPFNIFFFSLRMRIAIYFLFFIIFIFNSKI